MLLLQAGSLEFDRACIARIQPVWDTLSAKSLLDLLNIPVAAAKQAAELCTQRQREEGTHCGSAPKTQRACALLQLQCSTAMHMAARCTFELGAHVPRHCVQPLSTFVLSPIAALINAQGLATVRSSPPLRAPPCDCSALSIGYESCHEAPARTQDLEGLDLVIGCHGVPERPGFWLSSAAGSLVYRSAAAHHHRDHRAATCGSWGDGKQLACFGTNPKPHPVWCDSPDIIPVFAEIGSGSMRWTCTCGTCGQAMTSLQRLLSKLSGSACEHLQAALPFAVCNTLGCAQAGWAASQLEHLCAAA